MSREPARRGRSGPWFSWFAILTCAVTALAGSRYLFLYSFPGSLSGYLYPALAVVGHLSLIVLGGLTVVWLPFRLLLPFRRAAGPAVVVTAALILTLVIVDTIAFAEHQFHLNVFTAALFEPVTWVVAGIMLVVFVVLFSVIATNAQRLAETTRPALRRSLLAALLVSLPAGHFLHALADARYDGSVTAFARYLPVYYPLTAKRFLAGAGLIDPQAARDARLARSAGRGGSGELAYPLSAMRCEPPEQPPDVMIILVDGLRFDALTAGQTPAMTGFASRAMLFDSHYSGGNSSRMGLFSLLYGLPSSYFDAFYSVQRPSELTVAFGEAGYEFAVYAAYSLASPAHLDRTAFSNVPRLQEFGDHPNEGDESRDSAMVSAWMDFLDGRAGGSPLFAYLHFDPLTANVPSGHAMPDGLGMHDLAAVEGNRQAFLRLDYSRRLRYVDELVGHVLSDLDSRGMLDEMVVVIAGDHGEEFDDSGQDLWFHGSAFSDYQVRTPLVLSLPDRGPGGQVFSHRTSHYDLAPTLLREVLGCMNPPADYSTGRNLLDGVDWEHLVVRSYYNQAVMSPDSVIVTYPGGIYEIRDREYRPTGELRVDRELVRRALDDMRRFYR
jgi:membrane-anchored protein YejM (alkaline phosphatase superfamily)